MPVKPAIFAFKLNREGGFACSVYNFNQFVCTARPNGRFLYNVMVKSYETIVEKMSLFHSRAKIKWSSENHFQFLFLDFAMDFRKNLHHRRIWSIVAEKGRRDIDSACVRRLLFDKFQIIYMSEIEKKKLRGYNFFSFNLNLWLILFKSNNRLNKTTLITFIVLMVWYCFWKNIVQKLKIIGEKLSCENAVLVLWQKRPEERTIDTRWTGFWDWTTLSKGRRPLYHELWNRNEPGT